MNYPIKEITQIVDSIFLEYLGPLGQEAFRKRGEWPTKLSNGQIWWWFEYERTPKCMSTTSLLFKYVPKDSSEKDIKKGFYLEKRFISESLDKAIELYKLRISRIVKLYQRTPSIL
ncbi:MAG: hypothetical protein PHH54_05835 [Candidatus Nanoarchaeia archaeon]|nr:hypothetical protein [Candidatus Nanoarchaeia archaeon]MDD5741476.1 hypothetical protein [Candidatus Nanoarchaeia archaeon]